MGRWPSRISNTDVKYCRQLASYDNPDLVGMDDRLNKLKGFLWNQNLRGWHGVDSTNATVANYIQKLGDLAVAMSVVNYPKVLSLFSSTNARIYQAFLGIDHVITRAAACGNPINHADGTSMSATWGSVYKAWITSYIAGQNALITHTAALYSAAIPTSDPAHGQFIDSFNQIHRGDSFLTFPVPQFWPNSPLAMQKRDADCTPAQPTTSSPTLAKSSFGNTRTPTITPAASLPSSMTTMTSTYTTATTVFLDDRICDNEATGQVGPCDQVGGIMIGKKSSEATGLPTSSAEAPAPKAQDPQISSADIVSGTANTGIITAAAAPASTVPTSSSPIPSVFSMKFGGPQGGVGAPVPSQTPDPDEHSPTGCEPGSPLEFLCWV